MILKAVLRLVTVRHEKINLQTIGRLVEEANIMSDVKLLNKHEIKLLIIQFLFS
jgi:hypothetical protein